MKKISQENGAAHPHKVTLKMIAEQAGVSVSCVTRCINNSGYVSQKKREQVQLVMNQLNYVPNSQAKALRGGTSKLLAYVYLATDENIFFTKIATRIEELSFEKGYTILSFALKKANAGTFKEVMSSLLSYGVDGLIFNTGSTQPIIDKVKELIRTISVPAVMIERTGDVFDVEKVLIDNTEGSYTAVSKLNEFGHRKIGFIGVEPMMKVEKERYEGYRQAMQDIDPEFVRQNTFFAEDYTVENGYRTFLKAIDSIRKRYKADRPTAFLIASDILAAGAFRAAAEQSVRIPDDYSVIGFDDTIAEFLAPPLATMQLPAEEIAEAALDILIEKIHSRGNHDSHRTVKIGPVFIARASVKDLRDVEKTEC